MNGSVIQLLVLAAIAVFFILRLRNTLGTRDGYEPPRETSAGRADSGPAHDFEVIEGGADLDISDYVDLNSRAGKALAAMKAADPSFTVADFMSGGRQAYELILMAFEGGDLDTLADFLSADVFDSFKSVVDAREEQGLTVEAQFVGVREMKIADAMFDAKNDEAEITLRFVGELTSAVVDKDGQVIEGDPNVIKKQKDVWTFARIMTSGDPNWQLVATGE